MKLTKNDLIWILSFIIAIAIINIPFMISKSIIYTTVHESNNEFSDWGKIIVRLWVSIVFIIMTAGVQKILKHFTE